MMRTYAFLLASVVALAGCDSSPSTPTPPTCAFTLSTTTVSIGAAGGSGSVGVSTGSTCAWTARSDLSWVTATGGTSVTGSGTFTFTVAAAAGSSSRTGTVTVAGQSVTVNQQGQACSYAIAPASRSFGAAGGTATFDVSAQPGCAWTAAPAESWVTVSAGGSGSGNGTVTYQVALNPGAASRTANIVVSGAVHAVTQAGQGSCSVSLDRDHDSLPVSGGSGRIEVSASSDCAWAASSDVAWMRVTDPSGGSGTGSRTITYAVDANGGAAARTGTITVGTKTVVITQAGTSTCDYAVSPVDVGACMSEGFTRTISVSTGTSCSWTASTPASWITLTSGAGGLGPGSITYILGSNFEAPRQANIEVRWPTPTAGQNVRVAQAGCTYGVSKTAFAIPAAGGDFSFDVVSSSTDTSCGGPLQDGCTWTAVPSVPWVTILSSMPARGDDRVSFRVAVNATGTDRNATITVRDRTVTITQVGF